VPFTSRVKDGRLAVCVNVVDITIALSDQEVHELSLALPCSVVERCLIEGVWLIGLHTKVSKYAGGSQCNVVAADKAGREHRSLLVVGFVEERADVVATYISLLDDLVNVTVFDKVKEMPHVSLLLLSCCKVLMWLRWSLAD